MRDPLSGDIKRDEVTQLPAGRKPRVCIIAAFNDTYAPIAAIARPNWEAYARRHGYACRWYPEGWHNDPSRPETYGDKARFYWYFDVMGQCDIVMYLDIDSLFVGMSVKIEDVLANDIRVEGFDYKRWPPNEPRFLWTYSDGGPQSGLWIARTDARTEKHLRFAYERAAVENNVRHGKIEPNGISDQDSMTQLMTVPPFAFTFGNCREAGFVGFHFPDEINERTWIVTCRGGSLEEKLATMKEMAARVHVSR